MEKPLQLSIGKVSELTDISVKRLRYYDEQGLCSPAYRDPDTGYRYYEASQIATLTWIDQLRSVDIPINDIQLILESGELSTIKQAFDRQINTNHDILVDARYKYEQVIEMRSSVLIALEQTKAYSENVKVSLITTEPCKVLTMDELWVDDEIDNARRVVLSDFTRLNRYAKHSKLVAHGSDILFIYNHLWLSDHPAKPLKVRPIIQINDPPHMQVDNIKELPARQCVTASHVGPYNNIRKTYDIIINWAKDNGLQLASDAMEEYRITASMVKDNRMLITQIYIPLKGQPDPFAP